MFLSEVDEFCSRVAAQSMGGFCGEGEPLLFGEVRVSVERLLFTEAWPAARLLQSCEIRASLPRLPESESEDEEELRWPAEWRVEGRKQVFP